MYQQIQSYAYEESYVHIKYFVLVLMLNTFKNASVFNIKLCVHGLHVCALGVSYMCEMLK